MRCTSTRVLPLPAGPVSVTSRGAFVPAFEDVAWALDPGGISDVVRTRRGYHLVFLIRKTMTRLEDKKEEVAAFLKSRPPTASEKLLFVQELRKKGRIAR